MSVSLADLRADCGEVYDNLTNGTTAATNLLAKATSRVSLITGGVAVDDATRAFADAFICQQFLGSDSSTDQAVGAIRVGKKEVLAMQRSFIQEAEDILGLMGYTVKGTLGGMMFEVVNQ
jgi:hypothetical protein